MLLPICLRSGDEEVQELVAKIGTEAQCLKIGDQFEGDDSAEQHVVVNEQQPDIYVPVIQQVQSRVKSSKIDLLLTYCEIRQNGADPGYF